MLGFCPGLPRGTVEGLVATKAIYSLDENPWQEPPRDVVRMGMAYAARYLKDLDDYGGTSSNRLKVVLVGLADAGKTSMAIRLEGGDRNRLPRKEERTVGVEIRDLKLGVGQVNEGGGEIAELDVKLWDFAGQRAYYDTHQVGERYLLVFYTWNYKQEDRVARFLLFFAESLKPKHDRTTMDNTVRFHHACPFFLPDIPYS